MRISDLRSDVCSSYLYAFDGLGVDGATGKGPVQIDDMQMGGVLLVEKLCLTRRIIGIDGGAIHIAFGKADDLHAFKINGWKDAERHFFYGFQSRDRKSTCLNPSN